MSTVIDAGNFLLANQLVCAALRCLEQGHNVSHFKLQLQTKVAELDMGKGSFTPATFLPVEFEVCITSLDGKKLPRITEAQAKKAAAKRGQQ